jgi:Peptidase inhibitor family I36
MVHNKISLRIGVGLLSILTCFAAHAGDENEAFVSNPEVDLSQEAYVCFFEHSNFEGKKTCYSQDWSAPQAPARNTIQLKSNVDDTFSSVKVGKSITVRGCREKNETKYYCKRFVGEINYLGDDWNDAISSLTVDKATPIWPAPQVREPTIENAYSLDDENHLINSKDYIDSERPSICLYSEQNYGGEEKCFRGEGPIDTEQDGWAQKTSSYRIGLGYTLCLEQPPSAPQPEGQGYDTATTVGNCKLPFGQSAAFASLKKVSTFQGNFRGFHIEKNSKYKRYM